MVVRSEKGNQQEQSHPRMDEGWWNSVLNDEQIKTEPTKESIEPLNEYDINMMHVDWDYAQQCYESDSIVEMNVYGYNRGGLLVEGKHIQGFVPVSHLIRVTTAESESGAYDVLASYMNQPLQLKVIECTPQQKRIVFSERAALAGAGKRNDLFAAIQIGDLLQGKVTNITEFGVFVDLGGVEGLIHISELSWGRVLQATDHVHIGDVIQVKVLQINEFNNRIALSVKQLQPNPWVAIQQRYHIGDHTRAIITSITHFGAFARLPEGIEGLIHISTLPKGEEQINLHQLFRTGQPVTVKILHIDCDRHRLGLGLIQQE